MGNWGRDITQKKKKKNLSIQIQVLLKAYTLLQSYPICLEKKKKKIVREAGTRV